MFYAHQAFGLARQACSYLLAHFLEVPETVYDSLVTAIHIHYCRPFTGGYGVGKLDEQIVPKELLEIHQRILELRHSFFAHSDADRFKGPLGKAHQVRIHREEGDTTIHIARLQELPEYYQSVLELLEALDQRTQYHIARLTKKNLKWLHMGEGYFILNLSPDTNELFVPADTERDKQILKASRREAHRRWEEWQISIGE